MSGWLTATPVVIEFVPPPLRLGAEGLEQRLGKLEQKLSGFEFTAVNVPEIREEEARGGNRKDPFEPRHAPRDVAREITRRFGLPAIVNHVVSESPADEFLDWLGETHEEYGIDHVVLVGPSSRVEEPIGPSVTEANRLARAAFPDLRIGNICIPGRRSSGIEESERMERKAECGIDFFTSQIVYHATPLIGLLDELAGRGSRACSVPILVSLCPLRSRQTVRFLRWLGVVLDEPTVRELTADPERVLDRSIAHLADVWTRVREHARTHAQPTPLGLNIAPVGPIPASATLELVRSLAAASPGLD